MLLKVRLSLSTYKSRIKQEAKVLRAIYNFNDLLMGKIKKEEYVVFLSLVFYDT